MISLSAWLETTWPADQHGDKDEKKAEDEDDEGDGHIAASVVQTQLFGVFLKWKKAS